MTDVKLVLAGRVHREELMDIEEVSNADLARCLRDLERVNLVSLGYRPTLRWLDDVAAGKDRISILDVGCGHGDMLRRIKAWGKRRGIETELLGIDLNPSTIRAAKAATDTKDGIGFEVLDLFDMPADRYPDIIISSLFAHHLDDAGLVRFVGWMEQTARLGWFINDLHRHPVSAYGLKLIFAIWPVHRFVRYDGPVSVWRAFSRANLETVVRAAGVPPGGVKISWWFPFRWGVGRRKADG